ncbi:capsule biosynthesis protein CapD [Nocardia panacis]|uniref:Capsule biosynthesis protein CapD n=1 Tax=Nocardia panacis TaxID=2340916 RepID=A0A3A4KLI8_9NOCA|nr:NAD(P)H-binding protein [Nocardia panacis]RJO70159.1 capsule biosynthesis protein CapD [Nocardia panacis]
MSTANQVKRTILVTGATGNIGGQLVIRLADTPNIRVRAVTRRPDAAIVPPNIGTIAGDLSRPETLASAMAGVDAMFLVSRVGPDADLLDLARRSGIRHVVLVSSITVQTHPHLGPAQENAAVESLLRESGMDWTILRPTQFASNAMLWAEEIRGAGVHLPFPDIGVPTIDPADIAAVAHAALTEPGHRGQIYPLTGPAAITARDQVSTIAEAIGRTIPIIEITRAEARAGMLQFLPPEAADAILEVTGGDVNAELSAVRDTVARITGTKPRTFGQWVDRNLAAFT